MLVDQLLRQCQIGSLRNDALFIQHRDDSERLKFENAASRFLTP